MLLAPLAAAQQREPRVPQAEHLRYELRTGLQYTDNRERRGSNGSDDWLFLPEVAFSFRQGGPRWQAHGSGEIGAEMSLQGGAGDRLRARLGTRLDWLLLPGRLVWRFEDHADVDSIDPLAPDQPDNRQQLNLFETGPVLFLGEPGPWRGRLHATWGRGDAEDSADFDHERVGAGAWLSRRDAVRAWEAGVETIALDYDRGSADYRRTDALLQFDNQVPLTGVRIAAGHTWLDFEQAPSRSHPLLRAELRWTPRQDADLRALLSRELSDAGRDLIGGLDGDPAGLRTSRRGSIGADPYRLRSAELQWQQRGPRSLFLLALFARDYGYLDRSLALDRESQGGSGRLRWALSPLQAVELEAGFERYEFSQLQRRDDDRYAGLSFERRLDPRWRVRASLAHFRRGSDAPGVGYRENVLTFWLVYGAER
jgi:hypothetical protein